MMDTSMIDILSIIKWAAGINYRIGHRSFFDFPIISPNKEKSYLRDVEKFLASPEFEDLGEDIKKKWFNFLCAIGSDHIGSLSCLDTRSIDNSDGAIFAKGMAISYLTTAVEDSVHSASNLDNDFMEEAIVADLGKYYMIFSDINGFKKAINGILGHGVGDQILSRLFLIFMTDARLRQYAYENGFVYLPTTAGGDEFIVCIKAVDDVLFVESVDVFIELMRDVFAGDPVIKRLADFSSPEIAARAFSQGIDLPDGFSFDFSLSFGYISFDLAFSMALSDESFNEKVRKVSPDDFETLYRFFINHVVETIYDSADFASYKDKERIREKYSGKGRREEIMAILLDSRGENLAQDNARLTEELAKALRRNKALESTLKGINFNISAILNEAIE